MAIPAIAALIVGVAYLVTLPIGGGSGPTAAPSGAFFAIASPGDGVGIGQVAPSLASDDGRSMLIGLDGKPISLDAFGDHPIWIVFWATWCTPCQQEASDIRAAYHAHRDDGMVVLAIDVQEPAAAVRAYAQAHDLDYPIGLDAAGSVKERFGAWGLPSHYFLDAHHVIRDRYFGQMTAELMGEHLASILRP
jgi:cytochrome c biogenesis protein CcmG, thiol:disulfide interchange protein DsbE